MKSPANIRIQASQISGTLNAIPSKSHVHRLLICAALSNKPSKIACSFNSEDILATIRCLQSIGADIKTDETGFSITPICFEKIPEHAKLDVGESGSTLRFMLPIIAALGVNCEFHMHGKLSERPLSPLKEELIAHGYTISKTKTASLICNGKLERPHFKLAADVSSQFISGLLFALPLMGGGTLQLDGAIESASYIDMTIEALQNSGIQIKKNKDCFTVTGIYQNTNNKMNAQGDWSNAAFWLSLGALNQDPIAVSGLNLDSCQGDKEIIELLKRFGAHVKTKRNSIEISSQHLHGIEIDASNIPDLVPILALVACKAQGTTHIYNAQRLRLKESDRLETCTSTLKALGAKIKIINDELFIKGDAQLHGTMLDSHNDHRIAMMAACASLLCDTPVTITNAHAVNKSYPNFFDDFSKLGAEVELLS